MGFYYFKGRPPIWRRKPGKKAEYAGAARIGRHALLNNVRIISMVEGPGKKILLVDTDEAAAGALTSFLQDRGYLTQTVTDYQQALTAVQNWKPHLVVLNILVQAFNPLDFISDIKKNPFTQAQKIIIFSQTPKTEIVTGPSPKVSGYLTKPVDFEALKAALRKAVPPAEGRQLSVMVADDDTEFSDLVKMFLEANNYKALIVNDPLAVLPLLRAEKPDALLLDIMMPRKDGFSIMQEMQDEASTARVPIIILSALRLENYQESGILTGLPEIVAHEIPGDLLLKLIEEQTSQDGPAAEPQKAARPRVLLADDQTELLMLMKEMVEYAGFEVVTANDVESATSQIVKRRTRPDLVLLDVNMPNVNGAQFCRFIKKNDMFKSIRVIFCSGDTRERVSKLVEECGADGYVLKGELLGKWIAENA